MKSALVSILVLIILMTPSTDSNGQSIPEKWQPGMKLEASYGGGMTEYGYNLSITDTESTLAVTGEHARTVKKKFSSKELSDLLAFLRKHNLEKIKAVETGPTHDKASESVILTWDGNVVGASESSVMDITGDQSDDFNAIQQYILDMFGKK